MPDHRVNRKFLPLVVGRHNVERGMIARMGTDAATLSGETAHHFPVHRYLVSVKGNRRLPITQAQPQCIHRGIAICPIHRLNGRPQGNIGYLSGMPQFARCDSPLPQSARRFSLGWVIRLQPNPGNG